MNTLTPARTFLALALACAVASPSAYAQESDRPQPLGRVEGMVFDSTTGAPLPDAAVFLWGTTHHTVTDTAGRFVLPDVPTGRYTLLFYHARLGELGISSGPRSVEVDPGEVLVAELAVPSWFTVVATQCLLEDHDQGTGTLAGWVGDGSSGLGMPQATVTLSWNVAGASQPMRMQTETDASGWYRVCHAPAETPITASARFLNLQGLRREVLVHEGGMAEAGFLLFELKPAKVSGVVQDAETGEGVEGAEVTLRGTSFRDLTRSDGSFRFGDVPPGTYMLLTDHLQYGVRQDTLVVPSGRTLAVSMRIDTRAIELDPLTVEVESVPLTRRAMGGLSITREQIEKLSTRGLRDAAEVLQALNVPGVTIRRRADGSLCVGFMPGQATIMRFGSCNSVEVYINDVHATSTEMALHIPPEAIDRIVLFRPVEAGNLFPINSANGVMVIYTRH